MVTHFWLLSMMSCGEPTAESVCELETRWWSRCQEPCHYGEDLCEDQGFDEDAFLEQCLEWQPEYSPECLEDLERGWRCMNRHTCSGSHRCVDAFGDASELCWPEEE